MIRKKIIRETKEIFEDFMIPVSERKKMHSFENEDDLLRWRSDVISKFLDEVERKSCRRRKKQRI